jgi:hypothetical protein
MSDLTKSDVIDAEEVGTQGAKLTPNQAFVKALRDIADFFSARPDMPTPYTDRFDYYPQPDDPEVADFARWLSVFKKRGDDTFFEMVREFGPLSLRVAWYRNQVCTPVVVGKEEVEEEVVVSKVTEMRKVLRDKIEWKCPKVLAPKEIPDGA